MISKITAEKVDCPLCGSDNSRELFVGRDFLHGTEGKWPVVHCNDCEFVYTNPRPTSASMQAVYPADYNPHRAKIRSRITLGQKLQKWALQQRWNYPPHKSNLFGKLLSWPVMIRLMSKSNGFDLFAWHGGGRLLDFGCGSGGYLNKMQRLGWKVMGMDMSEAAVEQCRRQNIEAYVGADVTEQFEPESFDVVTLWHVLEHLPEPGRTIRQIAEVLKPGGKLVMAVPNFESPLAKKFGKYWYGLDLPRHLSHFTKKTLIKLTEMSGFGVEKITGQFSGKILHRSSRYKITEEKSLTASLTAWSKTISRKVEKLYHLFEPEVLVMHAFKHAEKDISEEAASVYI